MLPRPMPSASRCNVASTIRSMLRGHVTAVSRRAAAADPMEGSSSEGPPSRGMTLEGAPTELPRGSNRVPGPGSGLLRPVVSIIAPQATAQDEPAGWDAKPRDSISPPHRGLRQRVQLRQAPRGTSMANALSGDLRRVAHRSQYFHVQPAPPHPGTVHQGAWTRTRGCVSSIARVLINSCASGGNGGIQTGTRWGAWTG
jgi:hypothetical protein